MKSRHSKFITRRKIQIVLLFKKWMIRRDKRMIDSMANEIEGVIAWVMTRISFDTFQKV